MRVAVIGATGVIGRAAVPALLDAGHHVVGLARSAEKATALRAAGAEARGGSLLDHDGLVSMFRGADVVCNFATRVPVGLAALRPRAWRAQDRLRTDGVRRVVEAARSARVRRVVQESVSFLYADRGDDWVHEDAALGITRATEPASVGESLLQDYTCESRAGVVLRLGTIVGDDPMTRFVLDAARRGRPVGLGSPDGWAHLVHEDDLGSAVVAALGVPGGVYNVGSEPVLRAELVAGYARTVQREQVGFLGPVARRLGGVRLEPLARSLRVSSDLFRSHSGWRPVRDHFDPSWFARRSGSEAVR